MMTSEELSKKYFDNDFKESFAKYFTLSIFYKKSIFREDYIPSDIFSKIYLTEEGEKLEKKLKNQFNQATDSDIKYILFRRFYSENLLIDLKKTDYESLLVQLNKEIVEGKIYYPWFYGRLLYDKYFDKFEGGDEKLTSDEAWRLLEETPKGFFQLNDLTVGPFGTLTTNTKRFIPPTKDVFLWHCTDPSCNAFHSVRLMNPNNILKKIGIEADKILADTKESEWSSFYFDIIKSEDYYYDFDRTEQILSLLSNSFGEDEIKELLNQVINSKSDIRKQFPNEKRLKGSSSEIVKGLDKSECIQLLSLVDDSFIIVCLEELIEVELIKIPRTEIRNSKINVSGGFYDITLQCSQLGIRSKLGNSNQSIVRLVKLIESVHDNDSMKNDLEWKLMNYKRDSFIETIENYVLSEEPRKVIQDSILYGPKQAEKAIELFYGNFWIPQNEGEKEFIIEKMLWKLGFEIGLHPTLMSEFWKNLKTLKEIVFDLDKISISKRDEVRSAAVNLFVRLEDILEHSLSYITWVLLSDHFIETKFKYNFEEARNKMCSELNGHEIGSDHVLELDNSGNNNLFGLIEGFTALVQKCDTILNDDLEKYKRPENQIPHFHNKAILTSFPFDSRFLLLNISNKAYEEVKSLLINLPKEFSKHNVASVRNRLEHKSRVKNGTDNFPTPDEIINACECIEEVVSEFEENGIYPNVFLFNKKTTDSYNRTKYELNDYKGLEISIRPIPQFSGNRLPNYKQPQLISPIIKIGESMEPIRFGFYETSQFFNFWKNFPLKKSEKKIEKVESKMDVPVLKSNKDNIGNQSKEK